MAIVIVLHYAVPARAEEKPKAPAPAKVDATESFLTLDLVAAEEKEARKTADGKQQGDKAAAKEEKGAGKKAAAGEQTLEDVAAGEVAALKAKLQRGGGVQGAILNPRAANDALVQQFAAQYQPLVTAELAFIRLVCSDLAPEKRQRVKAASEQILMDAAKQMAQFQQGGRPAVVQINGKRTISTPKPQPVPERIIREGLARVLQESLTSEQWDRYKQEAAQRAASRKRAAIQSVVARLDAVVFLTADQRDSLSQSIADHWQEKWENWLMLSMYGGQYMPQIPEKCVECLTDDQRGVWQGLQKIEVGVFNFNLGGPAVNDDGWWEGKAEKKPPTPEAQRFFNRLLERLR